MLTTLDVPVSAVVESKTGLSITRAANDAGKIVSSDKIVETASLCASVRKQRFANLFI